jgi:hypothetical protein
MSELIAIRLEDDLDRLRQAAERAGESFGAAFDIDAAEQAEAKEIAAAGPNIRTFAAVLCLACVAMIVL